LAQSGNGIDLGSVYRLLTEVAETVRAHSERFDRLERRMDQTLIVLNEHTRILNEHTRILNEHTRILNEHTRVLNDHGRQLASHSRELDDLRASVTELRKDVGHYHDAVTSQGIHYSDLEGRVLRVERHLNPESGE
jgi:chromosome segregation ATPase